MSAENKTPMVFSEAPSNIALIKYMGKVAGAERNKPTNASFSLTLDHLRSKVEIVESSEAYDSWETITGENWIPTSLSERGRKRFLTHFGFLKQKLGIHGHFLVRSANNFPSDCGIASSASSFAALTMASYELAKKQNPKTDLSVHKVAELSRIGSGSSIRSFFAPFAIWDDTGARELPLPYSNIHHQVIVVEKAKKAIGSSDAHERVTTSLLFRGRPERANERLQILLEAWRGNNWADVYKICWAEFWDMHALFSTSNPPFQYMLAGSLEILTSVDELWQKNSDGPVVTMDAGANVHLLWRRDQTALMQNWSSYWQNKFTIIGSPS